MSSFDPKFAELQAKVSAVLQMLITKYPDAASEAKHIVLHDEDWVVEQETIQADEARGNAVAALISGAGQLLASVPDYVAPEPEPEPE